MGGPDRWLAEASARGAGIELETMLTRAAVLSARRLPEEAVIGLNVSGEFVRAGSTLKSIVEATNRSLVLEIDRKGLEDPGLATGKPANGELIQVDADGSKTVLAERGLDFPTGLAVAVDGTVYISNDGTSDKGEIVKVL